ncbi:uncharacterized protein LOC109797554 isoform X1 [Cajanus cajan]|uniref:uncharacterized protein LOC109797554 isoform X1 n=1 Tax=Cajanus cajan TaxID=3821 RepID=UPI00098DD2A2|nr:uncharacterized protein LOC109797554 isoform X1 [Cajanus cajan]XP_020213210.1 uncharacterized protein LOC109797554 isoform X1 [Cajanus cajan]XP_029126676.1 uncharacterized protein LOC109797554 isoform X1 [Cajanus cajan]XP_029126677.1 uncharacterized protein LOC109797554 isoform X1 [Cajanus cajan]XP_029126678.1 uncharacterized protein LOC109797554 isoform X1 [Cajanus cajan]
MTDHTAKWDRGMSRGVYGRSSLTPADEGENGTGQHNLQKKMLHKFILVGSVKSGTCTIFKQVGAHYFEEGNVQLDAKHECKDATLFQQLQNSRSHLVLAMTIKYMKDVMLKQIRLWQGHLVTINFYQNNLASGLMLLDIATWIIACTLQLLTLFLLHFFF